MRVPIIAHTADNDIETGMMDIFTATQMEKETMITLK